MPDAYIKQIMHITYTRQRRNIGSTQINYKYKVAMPCWHCSSDVAHAFPMLLPVTSYFNSMLPLRNLVVHFCLVHTSSMWHPCLIYPTSTCRLCLVHVLWRYISYASSVYASTRHCLCIFYASSMHHPCIM